MVLGKKGGYFRLGMGPKFAPSEGQKIPCQHPNLLYEDSESSGNPVYLCRLA